MFRPGEVCGAAAVTAIGGVALCDECERRAREIARDAARRRKVTDA
jgi:hypothetical protein